MPSQNHPVKFDDGLRGFAPGAPVAPLDPHADALGDLRPHGFVVVLLDVQEFRPHELRLRHQPVRINLRDGDVGEVSHGPARLGRVHVEVIVQFHVLPLDLLELRVRLVEPPEVQQGHAQARGQVQGNIRRVGLPFRREFGSRLSLCPVERGVLVGALVDRRVVRRRPRRARHLRVLRLPLPLRQRPHVLAARLDQPNRLVESAAIHLQLGEDVHQRGVRACRVGGHEFVQGALREVGVAHLVVHLRELHGDLGVVRDAFAKILKLLERPLRLADVHVQPRLVPPVVVIVRVQTQGLAEAVERLSRVVQTDGHLRQVVPFFFVSRLEVRRDHEEIERLLVVLELGVDGAQRGVRVRLVGYQPDHLREQLDRPRVLRLALREEQVRLAELLRGLRADDSAPRPSHAPPHPAAPDLTSGPRGGRTAPRALKEHGVVGVFREELQLVRVGDVDEIL